MYNTTKASIYTVQSNKQCKLQSYNLYKRKLDEPLVQTFPYIIASNNASASSTLSEIKRVITKPKQCSF